MTVFHTRVHCTPDRRGLSVSKRVVSSPTGAFVRDARRHVRDGVCPGSP